MEFCKEAKQNSSTKSSAKIHPRKVQSFLIREDVFVDDSMAGEGALKSIARLHRPSITLENGITEAYDVNHRWISTPTSPFSGKPTPIFEEI